MESRIRFGSESLWSSESGIPYGVDGPRDVSDIDSRIYPTPKFRKSLGRGQVLDVSSNLGSHPKLQDSGSFELRPEPRRVVVGGGEWTVPGRSDVAEEPLASWSWPTLAGLTTARRAMVPLVLRTDQVLRHDSLSVRVLGRRPVGLCRPDPHPHQCGSTDVWTALNKSVPRSGRSRRFTAPGCLWVSPPRERVGGRSVGSGGEEWG